MPRPLQLALLADGSSDEALLPLLLWLVRRILPTHELATPRFATRHPTAAITDEIGRARVLFRPDLLFVHRDA